MMSIDDDNDRSLLFCAEGCPCFCSEGLRSRSGLRLILLLPPLLPLCWLGWLLVPVVSVVIVLELSCGGTASSPILLSPLWRGDNLSSSFLFSITISSRLLSSASFPFSLSFRILVFSLSRALTALSGMLFAFATPPLPLLPFIISAPPLPRNSHDLGFIHPSATAIPTSWQKGRPVASSSIRRKILRSPLVWLSLICMRSAYGLCCMRSWSGWAMLAWTHCPPEDGSKTIGCRYMTNALKNRDS